jgi:hypothetical protein
LKKEDDTNNEQAKNETNEKHSQQHSSSMPSSSIDTTFSHSTLQLDYFGEPVTFLRQDSKDTSASSSSLPHLNMTNAMASLDGFVMAIVSRGQTCRGGGSEDGVEMKSSHSVAMAWAECFRHAAMWNPLLLPQQQQQQQSQQQQQQQRSKNEESTTTKDESNKDESSSHNTKDGDTARNQTTSSSTSSVATAAPMLVVAAVGPLLAQTGLGYTRYIDHLLSQAKTGVDGLDSISIMDMARAATRQLSCPQLNPRERWHLRALDCMLRQEHGKALAILIKLLHSCPGDALAIALAMDLAHKLGDRDGALTYV